MSNTKFKISDLVRYTNARGVTRLTGLDLEIVDHDPATNVYQVSHINLRIPAALHESDLELISSYKFDIGDNVFYTGTQYSGPVSHIMTIKGREYISTRPWYRIENLSLCGYWSVEEHDLVSSLTAVPGISITAPNPYPPYLWGYDPGGSDDISVPASNFTIDPGFSLEGPRKGIQGSFTLSCECGVAKVYGENAASDMHSTWCPLYRKS
jgi:hypothetical protein